MPIIIPAVTAQHTARVASLRAILDATEAVDSYCVDYLTSEGVVDRDYLGSERVDHVTRTLAELDGIVTASAELAESNGVTADGHLFAVTVRRARSLADAIREAIVGEVEIAPEQVDGFTTTATLHADCDDCTAEAESARIMARATGSTGATHGRESRDAAGDLVVEHSATVSREAGL